MEVTNRILVQGIKIKLEQAVGQLVNALPSVLCSYRTIPKSTTREIPFNLVYNSEVLILAEVELETFTIKHYEQEGNDTLLHTKLDLIDEAREDVRTHMQRYKQKVVNAYNRR
ncbi:UNVERIFIED_CONTAM: hypothetical protein Sradi_0848000 [Sesamum radiatum]|uniref:Uncharacterized protein n=1 Tax=Sesamum radiatum TaxID=300843 RepID=A0AAW2V1H8_SESRA